MSTLSYLWLLTFRCVRLDFASTFLKPTFNLIVASDWSELQHSIQMENCENQLDLYGRNHNKFVQQTYRAKKSVMNSICSAMQLRWPDKDIAI